MNVIVGFGKGPCLERVRDVLSPTEVTRDTRPVLSEETKNLRGPN